MTTGSPVTAGSPTPGECNRARRHKIRPLTLAEHAVLAAISAHPKHRAGAFVSAPDGARRVAYRLTRAGYLTRQRRSPGAGGPVYRIAPLRQTWPGSLGSSPRAAGVKKNDAAGRPIGRPIGPQVCQAIGCGEPVRAPALMCDGHWRLVPADLRRRIERETPVGHAWTGLAWDMETGDFPMMQLVRIADRAILHVARRVARAGPVL
jgi:hypothetical protein